MREKLIAGVIFSLISVHCIAEPPKVNGKIIQSNSPVTILKIWGTHQERGFAYGYFLGEKISEIFSVYSKNISKCKYRKVRSLLENKSCFVFDDNMITEAEAMIEGMNHTKTNPYKLDYIDLLVINSLFDVGGIKGLPRAKSFACSSFMSWGEATKGTDLDGEAIIARHFDWFNSTEILQNQVVLIHIPSEPDEQPWLSIGVAGQIGAVSAMNKSGVSVFLHTAPFTGLKSKNSNEYIPILFALRKAIEARDFNNDNQNDVLDIQAALSQAKSGFARPCIVSALALAEDKTKERIAMVAELTPNYPYIVTRGNEYADEIPGDNLYTANSLLKTKNRRIHGTRNKNMASAIGDGRNISSAKNWELMRDHSRFKVPFNIETNIQFMQYIPASQTLKLSVSTDKKPAFLKTPVTFELNSFFSNEN